MIRYNFIDFLAAKTSHVMKHKVTAYNFDNIDPDWVKRWKTILKEIVTDDMKAGHDHDCCLHHACPLCTLKKDLQDYEEYSFNQKKWREKNL